MAAFLSRRDDWKARKARSDERLDHLGRFAKAHRLARMPVALADAIDALRDAGLFDRDDGEFRVAVGGTAAIYAYECDLGAHVPANVLRDAPGLDLVVTAPPDMEVLARAEAALTETHQVRLVIRRGDADSADLPADVFPLRVSAVSGCPLNLADGGYAMAVARDGRAVAFPVLRPAIWLALAAYGIDELDVDLRLQARLDFVAEGYGVSPATVSLGSPEDDEEGDMRPIL